MKLVNRSVLFAIPAFALSALGCSGGTSDQASGTESADQALDDDALAAIPNTQWQDRCTNNHEVGRMYCHAKVRVDQNAQIESFSTPKGFGPKDLVSAYAIPSGKSTETIAIVDAQDDPDAESDLATYRKQFGLLACTTANGCFKKVDQRGGSKYPTPDQGWAGEIMLDLEMASAACPSCKIILVEADTADTPNLGAAVNEAAKLGASVITNSYGGDEDNTNSASDSSYYHHDGVAIFASSGDSGYGVEYPAAGQYVIGVGGTTLAKSSSSRGWAEKAWGSGGSGCSKYTPRPSWQTESVTHCSHKAVADLSAVADPNTGVAVYDKYGSGGWAVYGGTSVASPLVASIFAATGHGSVDASFVWSNTSDFYDVTSGSNGTCKTKVLCNAGKGWDAPTGWGTPDATKIAASN